MLMNRLEVLAMNNPVRAWFQRHHEVPLLKRLGGTLDGLTVLEIGCGRGLGTHELFKQMNAGKIIAIDYDPGMIERARKRLAAYPASQLEIRVGDATQIKEDDQSFDAIVTFAALHHVPDWQKAVSEIARLLKPGGRFFFEEVTAQWIHRWPYRVLFEHPMENRFSGQQFIDELERQGIEMGDNWVEEKGGDFIFGAGRRKEINT